MHSKDYKQFELKHFWNRCENVNSWYMLLKKGQQCQYQTVSMASCNEGTVMADSLSSSHTASLTCNPGRWGWASYSLCPCLLVWCRRTLLPPPMLPNHTATFRTPLNHADLKHTQALIRSVWTELSFIKPEFTRNQSCTDLKDTILNRVKKLRTLLYTTRIS